MKRLSITLLLLLSIFASPAFAKDCLPAPRTRLWIGANVVVNVGQVNMRALPAVSTGIRQTLYQGNTLTVIDGPSCNSRYHWWRVETASGRRGWVAEGDWDVYYLIPARDLERERHIPTPLEWSCLPEFDNRPCPEP
jgi:uncharacterized protein YgiM (DUF1202 family)